MFVVCLDFVQINSVSELALTANQLASDIHRLVVRTCPGPAVFGLFMELQALGDSLTCVCVCMDVLQWNTVDNAGAAAVAEADGVTATLGSVPITLNPLQIRTFYVAVN